MHLDPEFCQFICPVSSYFNVDVHVFSSNLLSVLCRFNKNRFCFPFLLSCEFITAIRDTTSHYTLVIRLVIVCIWLTKKNKLTRVICSANDWTTLGAVYVFDALRRSSLLDSFFQKLDYTRCASCCWFTKKNQVKTIISSGVVVLYLWFTKKNRLTKVQSCCSAIE